MIKEGDKSVSISAVTFPYLAEGCVTRSNYFGKTLVGGVDSSTCTFGLTLDTGCWRKRNNMYVTRRKVVEGNSN